MARAKAQTKPKKGKLGGRREGAGRPRKDDVTTVPLDAKRAATEQLQEERAAALLERLRKKAYDEAAARVKAEQQAGKAQVTRYAKLGDLPKDPLEAMNYSLRALQVSLEEVLHEKGMTTKERRAELRMITRAMQPLIPASALYEAQRKIEEARGRVDDVTVDPPVTTNKSASTPLQME